MNELGWLLLLLLLSAKRGPWPKGGGTKPGTGTLPPDENLGVHPLPPNPLKRK